MHLGLWVRIAAGRAVAAGHAGTGLVGKRLAEGTGCGVARWDRRLTGCIVLDIAAAAGKRHHHTAVLGRAGSLPAQEGRTASCRIAVHCNSPALLVDAAGSRAADNRSGRSLVAGDMGSAIEGDIAGIAGVAGSLGYTDHRAPTWRM